MHMVRHQVRLAVIVSAMFFLENIFYQGETQWILDFLDFREGVMPFNYHGVPIFIGMPIKHYFKIYFLIKYVRSWQLGRANVF